MPSQTTASYGQVIEYIQDRLYLASYTHAPTSTTPFPYGAESNTRTPSKRSKSSPSKKPVYFTIDDELLYNRFHADFGPLHIAHLYRFAVRLHEILGDGANAQRPVVFWSRADPRSRANAACLLACYMVLIQSWPPHLALAPIAQADPPYMPFRDAGYSQADYGLSVQDVVYGVWKAKEEGLCELKDFSLEEYERFERVDQGDFNWVTPDFVAFASPQHKPIIVNPSASAGAPAPYAPVPANSPAYAAMPKSLAAVDACGALPEPMKNVLTHFVERNVGLVVRLNSELYCPTYFTALGVEHVDMIFDDGTCPPLGVVRRFIKLAHDMITRSGRGVAVHCKAGLGRTGCLIGAYLVYRYGFTANDLIAYMRFMRPGMVVGPQQHWLHINQGTFRQWWWEDEYKAKIALTMPSTPTRASRSSHHVRGKHEAVSQTATPPPHNNNASSQSSAKRAALEEIDSNNEHRAASSPAKTTAAAATVDDNNLPAPTPGQPRKTARVGSPLRGSSFRTASFDIATDADVPPVPEIPEEHHRVSHHRSSHREAASAGAGVGDDEWALKRVSRSKRSSPGLNNASNTSPTAAAGNNGRSYSPGSVSSSGKPRAISYTTTTTRTTYTTVCEESSGPSDGETSAAAALLSSLAADQAMSDIENWDAGAPADHYHNASPTRSKSIAAAHKSGSGAGTLGVSKVRGSATPARRSDSKLTAGAATGAAAEKGSSGGVRKSSGRVGSLNARPKRELV